MKWEIGRVDFMFGAAIIDRLLERGMAIMGKEKKLSEIEWQDFKALPLAEKGEYFQGTTPHTLIAQ